MLARVGLQDLGRIPVVCLATLQGVWAASWGIGKNRRSGPWNGFKKAPVRITPDSSPADFQAFLAEELLHHWYVDVVKVDLGVTQTAFVFAPVVPKVVDDAGAECVRGLKKCCRRRVSHSPVREGDRAEAREGG